MESLSRQEAAAPVNTSSVDPATADAFIAQKRIGARIKRLRLRKSMGLVELGKHTALSASFLSQLETGKVVPTLRNLARIAMVFSKDLSYFFEPEGETLFRVHRKQERLRLPQADMSDPTYFFESLGYMVPDRFMDPYYADFVPLKKGQELRPHAHPGHEFIYVLSGTLQLKHGDALAELTQGDAVYFDAATLHEYRCLGSLHCQALIVTSQPVTTSAHSSGSSGQGVKRSVPQVAGTPRPSEPEIRGR